jgi:hypothetical protein
MMRKLFGACYLTCDASVELELGWAVTVSQLIEAAKG